jgi:hypothetical protein
VTNALLIRTWVGAAFDTAEKNQLANTRDAAAAAAATRNSCCTETPVMAAATTPMLPPCIICLICTYQQQRGECPASVQAPAQLEMSHCKHTGEHYGGGSCVRGCMRYCCLFLPAHMQHCPVHPSNEGFGAGHADETVCACNGQGSKQAPAAVPCTPCCFTNNNTHLRGSTAAPCPGLASAGRSPALLLLGPGLAAGWCETCCAQGPR